MDSNRTQQVEYLQPRSFSERQEIATVCTLGLSLSIPTLVDDMENTAERAFNGWPERLYMLSAGGQVVYQGGKGPYGFSPEELARFLEEYLTGSQICSS